MRKLISFMHVSLDGFVAGPNGEMNWIKVDEEIFDRVGERLKGTNSAFYGRVTYDMMEGYWPTAADAPGASKHDIEHSAWYKNAHKIVLSRTRHAADLVNTTVIGSNFVEKIKEIKRQDGPEIPIFGSPSATHALMQEGLIDGYWLFVNPIILGKGIPLFTGGMESVKLKLLHSRSFANGVTELSYEVNS